jgi:hypothetical protein
MSKMKCVLGLAGIVVLALALLFGCARLFWGTTGQSGWYIQLNIGGPESKAISVVEYDVTRVEVELFAPGESQPFYTRTWYAGDDPVSELIPVSEKGEYKIQVTHVGDDNGEPVEAEETDTFNIKAMIITVIDIIPGCIGTIEIEPGTPTDGTIGEPLLCAQLQYAVTLDGQISSANEWADTDFADMDWGLGMPPGPPYVNARVWAKHDATWLYLLYRVEWPSTDTDVVDDGHIACFWGNYGPPWDYADRGSVRFNGDSGDRYGWDDTQWYRDTDAGGEHNVEGAATHDGTNYWFEFRKELCSGDGYDWCLGSGDTYLLLAGLWDASIKQCYQAYMELQLLCGGPDTTPPELSVPPVDLSKIWRFSAFGTEFSPGEEAGFVGYFSHDPTVAVVASTPGVVVKVAEGSGDFAGIYDVSTKPSNCSTWWVEYNGVANVSVIKGDRVSAGDILGTVALAPPPGSSYWTHLCVRTDNLAYCPLSCATDSFVSQHLAVGSNWCLSDTIPLN